MKLLLLLAIGCMPLIQCRPQTQDSELDLILGPLLGVTSGKEISDELREDLNNLDQLLRQHLKESPSYNSNVPSSSQFNGVVHSPILGITSGNGFPGFRFGAAQQNTFTPQQDVALSYAPFGFTSGKIKSSGHPFRSGAGPVMKHLGIRGTDDINSFPVIEQSKLPLLDGSPYLSIDSDDKHILQNHRYDNNVGFSHYGGPNSRVEIRDSNTGSVTGSFSYIDANGQVQTRYYTADQQGFKVHGTDIV